MKRIDAIHSSTGPWIRSGLKGGRLRAMVVSLPVLFLAGCAAAVGTNDETTQMSEALVPCRLQACLDTRPAKPPGPSNLPDLTASRFYRGAVGGHVVNVENLGTGEAAATSTFVDYGVLCRQHLDTPAIAPGSWVLLPLTLPEHCFGPDVSYTVQVDEYGVVAESDETNNTLLFAPIVVGDGGLVRR